MAKDASSAALLKPVAERKRNLFSLDQRHIYSLKAGQINPVKALHFMPGDFFKMKVHDFTLTFPMNTAAFLRGRKETAFYSVYYSAVWSLFNQYMATRPDPKTSAFYKGAYVSEPRISLYDLHFACLRQWYYYLVFRHLAAFVDERNYISGASTVSANLSKIVTGSDFANWGGISFSFMESSSANPVIFNLEKPITGANSGKERNVTPHDFVNGSGTALTWRDVVLDMVGEYRAYNWVRKLDMLGYINIYPILSENESLFVEALSNISTDGVDAISDAIDLLKDYFVRAMNSIFAADNTFTGSDFANATPVYVNLYALCAYNAVFYHFFRNSYYDLNYYPHDYSLDFVSIDSNDEYRNIVDMSDFSLRFLDIEYHQWKKDLFTSVLPDTQFGAVSSLSMNISGDSFSLQANYTDDFTESDYGQWYSYDASPLHSDQFNVRVSTNSSKFLSLYAHESDGDDTTILHKHSISLDNLTEGLGIAGSGSTSFDVIALKRAEMLQQYRQTLMRAGNKTSDIFKAIYGGAPSSEHEDDVIPRFLETFGQDMFVDPVQSTANTEQGTNGLLGDLSARAKFNGSSKDIKFNAGHNFGVLLCLNYIVPEAEYNSYMFDLHNGELTPEQHFLPVRENYGLEEVYTDELNGLLPRNNIKTLGFAPAYHHKKVSFDMVHGAFCNMTGFNGMFNIWAAPRTELQNRNITTLRDFYINPHVLDNVFVQKANGDLSEDQFICNTYMQIAATRELTKVGLINFV